MKNDYKRRDFYIRLNEDNEKQFYILINNEWVKIEKDVYMVYQSDYKKTYRDQVREMGKILHYKDVDDIQPYICEKKNHDPVLTIYMKDLIIELYHALDQLENEEKELIYLHYFCEVSERELSTYFNKSKTSIHHKKNNILRKLRLFLDH